MPSENTADRLVRLLGLAAYLDGRGPVSIRALAQRFDVSPEQIRQDIDQLWVTGTPGYWPHDLIDFDAYAVEEGYAHLTEARGLTRPLRLGQREAITLVAALRALREAPAVASDATLAAVTGSVLDKLTNLSGEAASAVDVSLHRVRTLGSVAANAADTRATLVSALGEGRRVELTYVSADDHLTVREVDPAKLLAVDSGEYLLAWCHQARGRRTFRLDRIVAARQLAEPVDPDFVVEARKGTPHVSPALPKSAPVVTLTLKAAARWFAEDIPCQVLESHEDGTFTVALAVGDPIWLRRTLLGLAPAIIAVDPPEVAADLASEAVAALENYA